MIAKSASRGVEAGRLPKNSPLPGLLKEPIEEMDLSKPENGKEFGRYLGEANSRLRQIETILKEKLCPAGSLLSINCHQCCMMVSGHRSEDLIYEQELWLTFKERLEKKKDNFRRSQTQLA